MPSQTQIYMSSLCTTLDFSFIWWDP